MTRTTMIAERQKIDRIEPVMRDTKNSGQRWRAGRHAAPEQNAVIMKKSARSLSQADPQTASVVVSTVAG